MREKYKKWFLAGFIESKGILSISIRKSESSLLGISIDPEFFIYQHKSGRSILEMAKEIFHTGTISEKDPDLLVFGIRNRRSIKEKVIPFFEKYVMPLSEKFKRSFPAVKEIVDLEDRGEHRTKEGMIKILKLSKQLKQGRKWDKLIERLLRDYTPDSEEEKI